MEIYKHMMIGRDGHWWDKEMTVGWYVTKIKNGWKGVALVNGRKIATRKDTRTKAMKRAIQILNNKLGEK